VTGLLTANLLMLATGLGVLAATGLLRRRALHMLGLAYAVGIATVGVVAANLALVPIAVGMGWLALIAGGAVAAGCFRLVRDRRPQERAGIRLGFPDALDALAIAAALALLVNATRAFAVKPLQEWDGWALWASRARALYEFDGVWDVVFADLEYGGPYPILFPSLEAVGFRAMGEFDGTLIHVQLALLAFAFVGAVWALLRPIAVPGTAGVAALAIVSAPAVLDQLSTNYADMPLAFFVAIGLLTLVAWIVSGEAALLIAAAIVLGAAANTKNEGMLFALTAFVAAGVVALLHRERSAWHVAAAAAAAYATAVPWLVYVQSRDLPTPDYDLSNLVRPGYLSDASYRVGPVLRELLAQIANTGSWGYLLPLFGVGLLGALVLRRWPLAMFALLWTSFSFFGLVMIYWISFLPLEPNLTNSSNRTVVTLIVGAAAMAPALLARRASVSEP
jgi:hypothetical protein